MFAKQKMCRSCFKTIKACAKSDQGPLPSSVYLDRQNVIHMIKWTRPSPSILACCKQPKTGRWEGLGTRLNSGLHGTTQLMRHGIGLNVQWMPSHDIQTCCFSGKCGSSCSKLFSLMVLYGISNSTLGSSSSFLTCFEGSQQV